MPRVFTPLSTRSLSFPPSSLVYASATTPLSPLYSISPLTPISSFSLLSVGRSVVEMASIFIDIVPMDCDYFSAPCFTSCCNCSNRSSSSNGQHRRWCLQYTYHYDRRQLSAKRRPIPSHSTTNSLCTFVPPKTGGILGGRSQAGWLFLECLAHDFALFEQGRQ